MLITFEEIKDEYIGDLYNLKNRIIRNGSSTKAIISYDHPSGYLNLNVLNKEAGIFSYSLWGDIIHFSLKSYQ